MPLARDGYGFIAVFMGITALSFALNAYLGLLFSLLTLIIIWFFRDPKRVIIRDDTAILAPADGRVTHVMTITHQGILYHHIVIFLSVFNVHVNRIPCDGLVVDVQYQKGQFKPAFDPSIGTKNERMHSCIQTHVGQVHVIQLAGLLARRIVCRLTQGQQVRQGDRFGMIKFSSRTDIYVPCDTTDVCVQRHDRVIGGVSVVARAKAV